MVYATPGLPAHEPTKGQEMIVRCDTVQEHEMK
jgi:hypothetical protein